jgi:hypothetical protein
MKPISESWRKGAEIANTEDNMLKSQKVYKIVTIQSTRDQLIDIDFDITDKCDY